MDTWWKEERNIRINAGDLAVRFKFEDGAGITIRKDNPCYLEEIGRWFCNEVDALPKGGE